jgi:hypothetical protein
MGFLDGVRDLFPHTVTVAPWTGQNQYGEATYGDDETYQAKIERGVDLARAGIGDRSIVPQYKVFLAEPVQVDVRDRLTLDAAFGERNEAGAFTAPASLIMMVKPIYDEREWVCTILYCG